MYKISKLKNGLRILTAKLEDRDSVGLGIWARVGGRFESKPLSGVSHFLEHMLFKGTKRRSTRKIKADVEGLGGVFNAFTGEEMTCYFVKILKQYAFRSFDVLADMVNDSLLDTKEINKERTVILEEIKMYLDLPSHHVQEMMGELLWPNQALGRPIAGSHDTVSQIDRSVLTSHLKHYYHPKNLLVTFCGEIDHEEICETAEKYFGRRESKTSPPFERAVGQQKLPRFNFLNKKTEQMHFVVGFHSLHKSHPDRYALAILNIVLGGNMSSRLFEEVREKRGLAYEIRSGLSFFEDTGAIAISAGLEPKKAALAARVIMRELKKLKSGGVPNGELKRAKDYYIGQFSLGLEDTLDHMLWVGERAIFKDELPNKAEIFKKIEAVTSEQIRDLAKRLFKTNGLNLTLIGSYGSGFENEIRNECDCG